MALVRPALLSATLATVLLGLIGPAAADDSRGGAMRMYRDPETGMLGAPPPSAAGIEATPPSAREQALSAEPLIEEPAAAPAGGVKVNLQGRFRAAVTRHVGSSGPSLNECVQSGAAPR
jgi:hypothetical protein